ncbi:hypothetical protein ENKOMM257B_06905 [Enterobacter kobei]|uniref:phage baseplate protein n=1 Tax=Enterobacter kobei TaxID=208224 RepID=UPI003B235A26
MDISSLTMMWNGYGDKNFRVSGGAGTLTVDVVEDEGHVWQNDVTQYPVETGSDITDNIRPKPDELTFKCFVGGAPIKGYAERAADAVEFGTNLMNGDTDALLGGNQRLQEAFNQVRALRDSRQLVTVATRYRTYTSCAVVSVEMNRVPDDGEALSFTMSLRQVRIVSSQMTRVPEGMSGKPQDMSGATAQRAQGTVNAGPSKGSNLTPKQVVSQPEGSAAKKISALARVTRGL